MFYLFLSHALRMMYWNIHAKFHKNPMLYNGVFGCHGNTCYVIFIGAILYMLYSIGPINACTDLEINQYKIDEVRKYAKIVFYLTSRLPVQKLWLK